MKSYKLNVGIILSIAAGLLTIMLPACRDGGYSAELTAIDSLLQTDPDSAWQRLCNYDTLLLRSDNDRYYYALLSAESNDKTFHEDTAENAISEAAAYFVRKNDKRKAMRSMFYKGIAYQNSSNYGPAIITLLKSIEMSDTAEHFYRGKIYNAISEIYKEVSDAPQELEYARLSLEEYQKLDSLVFIEDLQLAVGYALCRNNRFEEGINKMQQVYKAAEKRGDDEMTEAALIYMALGYLWEEDNKRAKDCLSFLYNNKFLSGEYIFLYLNSMIYTGSPSDSIEMVKNILSDELDMQENLYRYYAYRGNYKEAYLAATRALRQNDSVIEEIVHSNVSREVKKYMDEKQNKANLKIRRLNGIILWVIISVILLICLILALIWVYSVSKKKKEKDLLYSLEILTKEKSEIIEHFNKLISDKEILAKEKSEIIKRIDDLSTENENLIKEKSEIVNRVDKLTTDNKHLSEENDILKSEQIIHSNEMRGLKKKTKNFESDLISKLFGELDSLHAHYYLHGNSEKGKTILLNQLSEQIMLLREDKKILLNMEGYINNISDGLLDDVYEHARLNVHQRRLVALLCIGFSKEAVCQVMGIEMSSFYTRMNRLTKRIEGCESSRKNELLALIGREKS
ncbi:MAG: hypothetical protein HDR88_17395 [Bacteroides sp.]|nr:hypothetical protein [Bacteroides sp.]MBD5358735.1 hypothetical protein [Bacteroides sp.]